MRVQAIATVSTAFQECWQPVGRDVLKIGSLLHTAVIVSVEVVSWIKQILTVPKHIYRSLAIVSCGSRPWGGEQSFANPSDSKTSSERSGPRRLSE